MKKNALVTTHRANNFGAMLQAYSLACACNELGSNTEVLDWRSPHYEWQYHSAWRMRRNPLPALKHLIWYWQYEKPVRVLFDEFRQMLPLSTKITSQRKLRKISDEYENFIVGSDQVWNPLNSAICPDKFDRAFLLDFVQGKTKNAYAASIGVKGISPTSLLSEFKKAWGSFTNITMREHAGAEYVSSFIGRPVETVLDPVLLHDSSFWGEVAKALNFPDKFIFKYNVRCVNELEQFAREYAGSIKAEIVSPLIPSMHIIHSKGDWVMGPREFLSAIQNSEAVVTSSFHAAAFSVVFGKKLYLIRRFSKGDPNSRFDALFSFAGVEPEQVFVNDNYEIVFINCQNTDRSKIVKARESSLKTLKGMLV